MMQLLPCLKIVQRQFAIPFAGKQDSAVLANFYPRPEPFSFTQYALFPIGFQVPLPQECIFSKTTCKDRAPIGVDGKARTTIWDREKANYLACFQIKQYWPTITKGGPTVRVNKQRGKVSSGDNSLQNLAALQVPHYHTIIRIRTR